MYFGEAVELDEDKCNLVGLWSGMKTNVIW